MIGEEEFCPPSWNERIILAGGRVEGMGGIEKEGIGQDLRRHIGHARINVEARINKILHGERSFNAEKLCLRDVLISGNRRPAVLGGLKCDFIPPVLMKQAKAREA